MDQRKYYLLDVFTDERFGGNPLAVFPDGEGLTSEQMQTIAAELNLSETVFIVEADDAEHDCRLRIFTPARELAMAGHPTIGTAFLLATLGDIEVPGQAVFEEGVGPIAVQLVNTDKGDFRVFMQQPLPQFERTIDDRTVLANLLSLEPEMVRDDVPAQVVSTGVPFLYIPLVSLDAIQQSRLRTDLWEQHIGDVDIFIFTMETLNAEHHVHSRMFAPTMNIREDPATGAASGPLGAYLVHYGLLSAEQATEIIAEQGFEMGRPSLIGIHISSTDGMITDVKISGSAVIVGEGLLWMP